MENILVINSGSTSLKYKVFDGHLQQLAVGNLEDVNNHEQALKQVLREVIGLGELSAVGHRVVHGGDKFHETILITDEILEELEAFNELAPLHNPFNLAGIKASKIFLPEVPQVAVFDTAFYARLPEVAQTYALPREVIERHNIRRYGFHGISHEFVMREAADQLKKDVKRINLITCHLGGGWSITAIKNGQAIDTSMGYTPLEGLVMMTRPGDIDPGIIIKLLKDSTDTTLENFDVYNMLQYESGIKGLSGGISNFKDLLKEVTLGNDKAKLAFDVAIYRLCKYIGAYWTVLGGKVDAIVFTGAIGDGNPITRNEAMRRLKCLGKIKVLAMKTDEELMIAKRVRQLIS